MKTLGAAGFGARPVLVCSEVGPLDGDLHGGEEAGMSCHPCPDAEAQLCTVCPAAGSCESHPVGAGARVIVCRDSFCSPSPEAMTEP